jgi:orotidine-5'-phosphate decarboxylase
VIIDRLIEAIEEKQNPAAAGLDTRLEHIPPSFRSQWDAAEPAGAAAAVAAFNRALVDALADIVPCIKIQAACYELYGPDGLRTFLDTAAYARRQGLLVIADVKRGDIGSTSAAYSSAWIGRCSLESGEQPVFDADFITVNPYLGSDGVEPFLLDCRRYDKGVFMLVKTSNPSSSELQDLMLADGRAVYEAVADRVAAWGDGLLGEHGYSAVGAVVGATHPGEGTALRRRMPHTFFLLPGYGAQGARGVDLAGMFDASGSGGLVNASRSLLTAWKARRTDDFAAAARDEAILMREDIMGALRGARRFH